MPLLFLLGEDGLGGGATAVEEEEEGKLVMAWSVVAGRGGGRDTHFHSPCFHIVVYAENVIPANPKPPISHSLPPPFPPIRDRGIKKFSFPSRLLLSCFVLSK